MMKVLKKRLRFRSYKLQLIHLISQHAKEARFDFSMMMCKKLDKDNDYLKTIVNSGEERFHISKRVNRHNCRIWCSCLYMNIQRLSKSEFVECTQQYKSNKVIFLRRIYKKQSRILDMLEEYIIPNRAEDCDIIFQLYGAHQHFGIIVRQRNFLER